MRVWFLGAAASSRTSRLISNYMQSIGNLPITLPWLLPVNFIADTQYKVHIVIETP